MQLANPAAGHSCIELRALKYFTNIRGATDFSYYEFALQVAHMHLALHAVCRVGGLRILYKH
jgi:hypothetical protein